MLHSDISVSDRLPMWWWFYKITVYAYKQIYDEKNKNKKTTKPPWTYF